MFTAGKSLAAIEFSGLRIFDYTAGHDLSSSLAIIEVPPGAQHAEAWSKRSDKYYLVTEGSILFALNGVGIELATGDFCVVPQGAHFSYSNVSSALARLVLVHTPGFDLDSEVFVEPPRIDPDTLGALKTELERFGAENDATHEARPRRMLNITRDTGEFLAVLVRATAARRVLEIGTSNGYSTLWLAEAAGAVGGSVTTIEFAEYKIELASANFARSGLSPFLTLVHDDAGAFLLRSDADAYDLVFLDSERPEYPRWWPDIRRVLRPGGLLVVDNATSHVEQMAPFVALVEADPEFSTSLVPVGNGEFLAVRMFS